MYLLWVEICGEARAGIDGIFQFMFHIFNFYIFKITRHRRHLTFVPRLQNTVSNMATFWRKLSKISLQIPRFFTAIPSVYLPRNSLVQNCSHVSSSVSKIVGFPSQVPS